MNKYVSISSEYKNQFNQARGEAKARRKVKFSLRITITKKKVGERFSYWVGMKGSWHDI